MICPPIPKPLLEWLEKVYPNDLTQFDCKDESLIRQAVGQQQVLLRLKLEYNKQHS